MDEFMSSLGLGTTGRRTIESGPIPVVPTSLVRISGTAGATNQDVFSHSQPIFRSSSSAEGEPVPVSEDPSSTSILRSDLTPMIEWLTRHRARDNEPADTLSSSEEFAAEVPKIPKPYTILTPKDCAKIVGQSVHSIILHSCNDEFRQQCFNKLGVTSSRAVELQVSAKLNAIDISKGSRKRKSTSTVLEGLEVDTTSPSHEDESGG